MLVQSAMCKMKVLVVIPMLSLRNRHTTSVKQKFFWTIHRGFSPKYREKELLVQLFESVWPSTEQMLQRSSMIWLRSVSFLMNIRIQQIGWEARMACLWNPQKGEFNVIAARRMNNISWFFLCTKTDQYNFLWKRKKWIHFWPPFDSRHAVAPPTSHRRPPWLVQLWHCVLHARDGQLMDASNTAADRIPGLVVTFLSSEISCSSSLRMQRQGPAHHLLPLSCETKGHWQDGSP